MWLESHSRAIVVVQGNSLFDFGLANGGPKRSGDLSDFCTVRFQAITTKYSASRERRKNPRVEAYQSVNESPKYPEARTKAWMDKKVRLVQVPGSQSQGDHEQTRRTHFLPRFDEIRGDLVPAEGPTPSDQERLTILREESFSIADTKIPN